MSPNPSPPFSSVEVVLVAAGGSGAGGAGYWPVA